MQIITPTSCHLRVIRMVIMKRTENNQCWWSCEGRRTFTHCWWKFKLLQPLWVTVWCYVKELLVEMSYHPAVPLLLIHPKDIKSQEITALPYLLQHCSQQPKNGMDSSEMFIIRWLDKEDVVYIHSGVPFSRSTEWNPATCAEWFGLEDPVK